MNGRPKDTSALLVNEEVLVVQPSLAVAVGLNEAIFVQQLHYWLKRSNHEREGRKWAYNSMPEWNKQFPFWSESTLRRAIDNLRKRGIVIVTSAFNKAAFDHTLWYSIDYDALDDLTGTERPGQDDPIDPSNTKNRSSQNDSIDDTKMDGPKVPKRTRGSRQNELDNTRDYTKITSETTTEINEEENNKVGVPTAGGVVFVVAEAVKVDAVPEAVEVIEAATATAVVEVAEPEPTDGVALPKAEWDNFVKALLWVCYGHEDIGALSRDSRTVLYAEAKRIVKAGYGLDDLRSWFSTKWKVLNKFKEAGIRPRPSDVRERIPVIRNSNPSMSNYSNAVSPLVLEIPQKEVKPGSGDETWDQMVRWHFTGSTWLEQIGNIRIVDVYELDGARVYEVDAGKESGWIADRVGKAIERELKIILSQSVRVIFIAEEGIGSGKQEVSASGGNVDSGNDRNGDRIVRQNSQASQTFSQESAPLLV